MSLIQSIADVICCFADAATIIFFIEAILGKRKNKINMIYTVIIISMCVIGWSYLSNLIPGSMTYVIGSIVMVFAFTFLFKSKFYEKILLGFGYEIIGYSSEIIIAGIMQRIWYSSLSNENMIYMGLGLSKLLCLLLILVISLLIRKNPIHKEKKYKSLIVVSLLISIAVLILTADFVTSNVEKFDPRICIMSVLVIALNVVIYYIFDTITIISSLKEHDAILENEVALQQKNYEQVKENYKETRRIIHDMDKHLKTLEEMASMGQIHDALDYISNARDEINETYQHIDTGNVVIDAMVSELVRKANNKKIDIELDINNDNNKGTINNYHLTIILGNLLDNAYNAALKCNDNAFIRVMILADIDKFVITIDNSCIIKDTNEVAESYGIENIRQAVKEEGGFYTTKIEENVYSAHIILPFSIG